MHSSSLERFVAAQSDIYPQVIQELRAGDKRSHWMWFVFPQIAGLGMSAMSQRFSLASVQEASEYLAHPVLGPRLLDSTELVLQAHGKTAEDVFGSIDAMKFRSSMTLFSSVNGAPDVFRQALAQFFGGQPDVATLEKLS